MTSLILGEMAVYEGKRPISAKGYILLAALALKATTNNNRLGSVYNHVLTILLESFR